MSWIDGYVGWYSGRHSTQQVGVSVTSGPSSEPVTVSQLQAQCRIDATDDQTALLSIYISAARAWCETFCQRTFPTQTLVMALDRFPRDCETIELRRGPVQSISSITYYDQTNTQQTVSSSLYYIDGDQVAPRLRPTYNTTTQADNTWPTTYQRKNGGIQITYSAGYSTVPAEVCAAILLVAADLYLNRSSQVEKALYKNTTAEALLSNYRTF